MPSPQTQAETLVVLTWNQENVILSDSAKKHLATNSGLQGALVTRTKREDYSSISSSSSSPAIIYSKVSRILE